MFEMDGFSALNLLDAPLEGRVLIEASAGTGKTHTITGLYLRLVLEKCRDMRSILVLSGVTDRAGLEDTLYPPTMVVEDLSELLATWQEA